MKVRLFVIRHGETHWNLENRINGQWNSSLTSTGVQESQRAGAYLRSVGLDKVYVSDLPRTLETLQYLQLGSGPSLVQEHRLRDRNFGPYNGQLYVTYVQAKHEEKQRLLTGCPETDGEYIVPRAGSSCVVTNSGLVTSPALVTSPTLGQAEKKRRMDSDEYKQRMLNEIEPAGVERYEQLYERIGDLIQDVVYEAWTLHPNRADPVNVLFITHCSPVRMCAMVLSSYLDSKVPVDLRKCDIPNNSITEFTVQSGKGGIDEVELVRLASTKHLNV